MVCKSLPDTFSGGIQTHTWLLSGALQEAGHTVSILTAGSFRQKLQRETVQGRMLIKLPFIPGRRLPVLKLTLEELFFNLAVRRWLKRNAQNYDVIHLQGRSGGLTSKEVIKNSVVTYHGLVGAEQVEKGSWDQWLHGIMAQLLERRPSKFAKGLIVVSDGLLTKLKEAYPHVSSPVAIIPNGVNEGLAGNKVVNQDELLFVGRLDPVKGIGVLMDAFSHFSPEVKLKVIGDGPELPKIEALIQAKGLGNRIELLGERDNAYVLEAMQTAFALVLPSFMEAQGLVLLEAAANGRPSISSDLIGTKEVIIDGYNGLRFPMGDSKALAEAVNKLHADPTWADQMGRNGREHVQKHFSWSSVVAQTEQFYHQILGI